jgi:hypothetical protein
MLLEDDVIKCFMPCTALKQVMKGHLEVSCEGLKKKNIFPNGKGETE